MSRAFWFTIFAAAATVCLAEPQASLVSGEATAYESRKEVQHVTLTADQLQALSQWLKQRQGGWGAHITEPSSEPALISLNLTRADGEIDHIGVITKSSGGHYMRLSVGPGVRSAYRSFGGVLKTRYAQQSIKESDLATLRQLLFQPRTP